MTPRTLLGAVALGAALTAVPATASAATITPLKSCYSRVPTKGSEPIVVALAGGIPGGRYQAYGVNGKASSAVGNFDAAGNAVAAIPNFSTGTIEASRGRTIQVAVREFPPYGAPPVPEQFAAVKVTNVALTIARTPRAAFRARRIEVSGLTPLTGTRTMYASWYSGKRLVKRIKLGVANACGYVSVRRSLIPRTRSTKFTLRVHAQKRYTSKKPSIRTTVRRYRSFF